MLCHSIVRQAFGVALFSISTLSAAQTLPPIFDGVERTIKPGNVIAEFPKNTFLENLLVDKSGDIYATSHEEGVIYRIDPKGTKTLFARVDGKVAGITRSQKQGFLLTGSDRNGAQKLYLIDRSGKTTDTIGAGDAVFLNGLTQIDSRTYLATDSYKASIWKIDVKTKQVSLWLQHELLARADEKNPIPAANGIKFDSKQRRVLLSNTAKQLLIEVPMIASGNAGTPRVLRDKVNIDDFVVDATGDVYAATHVYNSVIRIGTDMKVAVIAEAEQGMTGSTAVALHTDRNGKRALFVSTNGGMFLPPPSGVQGGKIVSINL
jgi:glutamine cyclotransferase